ncbi:MAG: phosphatidylglycerol lysyltransferase domain-containing protein [Muribaculaceae bacterium]|nr:phosphatidylglycerol lysyltransferase domain-containing protein [Muribaculaceae bacterium]
MLRSQKIQVSTATRSRTDVLKFKPLTIQAIPQIKALLEMAHTRSCDYTIGGLYMWTGLYQYEYCIYAGTLFIKGLNEDGSGSTAFAVPVGALSLDTSFGLLKKYAAEQNIPLIFSAVPEEYLNALSCLGTCTVTELTDLADYIYDSQALATLTGKHYNKKRNHVNRFVSDNPDYTLEEIKPDNISELTGFLRTLGIESDKVNPEMAEFEWKQCERVLNRYTDYPYIGALLRDNSGTVVAFTIGELSGDTLVLHIEKAEHLIPGSGESINRFFAEYITQRYPQIKFINREDCAGDPGLRFAKESYHPIQLLKKYNVQFK